MAKFVLSMVKFSVSKKLMWYRNCENRGCVRPNSTLVEALAQIFDDSED